MFFTVQYIHTLLILPVEPRGLVAHTHAKFEICTTKFLDFKSFAFHISDAVPQFRMNKNARKQLIYREHVFNRHVIRGSLTYWRCSQFAVCRCRARIKTNHDSVMTLLRVDHNHDIVRAPRPYGALKKLKRDRQLEQGKMTNTIENKTVPSSLTNHFKRK